MGVSTSSIDVTRTLSDTNPSQWPISNTLRETMSRDTPAERVCRDTSEPESVQHTESDCCRTQHELGIRQSRIEMHLVSRRTQTVTVAGRRIRFAAGESIHTENSYKHSPDALLAIVKEAGWRSLHWWTDPNDYFSIHLLGAVGPKDGESTT